MGRTIKDLYDYRNGELERLLRERGWLNTYQLEVAKGKWRITWIDGFPLPDWIDELEAKDDLPKEA